MLRTATLLALCGLASLASAAPLDLSAWSTHNFATLATHANGNWQVTGQGVRQTANGQPSLFLSAAAPSGALRISGQVRSTDADDDFIGWAFGFGGGDWLLIDWKQATQTHNFSGGTANNTPGSSAQRGLAASRVSGTPTGDEFWGHTNFNQDAGGGLTELARASTLGSSAYARNTWYSFEILLQADRVQMDVGGVRQFDIAGNFADGRWGFYNFSQPATEYRGLTAVSAVPEPGALLLAASGLGVLVLARRRASKR
jgi:Thrombospondin C-terminal region